jgi:hypothetical protein
MRNFCLKKANKIDAPIGQCAIFISSREENFLKNLFVLKEHHLSTICSTYLGGLMKTH